MVCSPNKLKDLRNLGVYEQVAKHTAIEVDVSYDFLFTELV